MFFPERGWKFSSVHVQWSASSLGLWGGLKSPCHHGTKKWRRFPHKNNAKGLCFTLLFQEIHCFFQQLALSDVFQSMFFLGNFRTRKSRDPLIQRLPWFLHGVPLFLLQNSYKKSDQRQEIIMTWGYAAYGEQVNENLVLQISESFPVTSRQMFHGFGFFFARFGQMFSLCFFRLMWIMM